MISAGRKFAAKRYALKIVVKIYCSYYEVRECVVGSCIRILAWAECDL